MEENVKKNTVVESIIHGLIFIYCFFCYYEFYLYEVLGAITKYYVVFFVLFLLLFSRKKFTFTYYHVAYILWFLLKIGSLLYAQPFENTGPQVQGGNFIMMTGLLVLLTSLDDMVGYVDKIISYSAICSFSLCVLALFFSLPFKMEYKDRMVLTILGQQPDPNDLAALYLFSFAIIMYLLTKKNSILKTIILGAGLAISLYAIILTGSRGGTLTAAVIALIFIVNIFKVRDKTQLLLSFGVLAVLPIGIQFIPPDIVERFTQKSDSIDTLTSERTVIWEEAWGKIKEHPFFGSGWGGYHLGNQVESLASHNTIITLVLDNGIIGAGLFLYPLIDIVIKSLAKWRILELMIIAAGIIPCLGVDGSNKRFWWNTIIIVLLLTQKRKKLKKTNVV